MAGLLCGGFNNALDCGVSNSLEADSKRDLFDLLRSVRLGEGTNCTGGEIASLSRALIGKLSAFSFSEPGHNFAPSVTRTLAALKRQNVGAHVRGINYFDGLVVCPGFSVDNLPLAPPYVPRK